MLKVRMEMMRISLLMSMFPVQAPDELLDTMKDLQSCVDKAQETKSKKKKKKGP